MKILKEPSKISNSHYLVISEEDDEDFFFEGKESPPFKRSEITPELDESENEVLDALEDYRENDYYKDFNTYSKYYEDAKI